MAEKEATDTIFPEIDEWPGMVLIEGPPPSPKEPNPNDCTAPPEAVEQ